MAINIEALRSESDRLFTEANALIEAAVGENRGLSEAEAAENETRFSRMKQIKAVIDDQAKFAAVAFEKGGDDIQKPREPGREEFERSQQEGRQITNASKIDRAEFSKAVIAWAATGVMEKKFATITTATQGGIYLPREVMAPIIPMTANTYREAIAIQKAETLALVPTTTTAEKNVPVVTGSAGGQVAENASSETENTPSLSESINLNVKTYQSGSVYYSEQQLAAGTVDLINNVAPTLVYEKELGLNATITAFIIADAGVTQIVNTDATTGFTYENLVDLNRKLPKRFDRLKVILLSDTAYSAAERLCGNDGHPVLNRDPQNQELLRFNGTPVLRESGLEAFGASKVVGLVISLIGFRLRDVDGMNLRKYDQVPAKPNQTGWNLFAYHGFGYAPSAVAKLKTPAS